MNFYHLFCLTTLFILGNAAAHNPTENLKDSMCASNNTFGKTVIRNTTYSDSVWTLGKVEIEKATLEGSVKTTGSCSVKDAVINGSVTSTGATKIVTSLIKGGVDVTGTVTINKSKIDGLIATNGSFSAEELAAEELDIMGRTTISNSSIKGRLRVIGALSISNASINSLDVTGTEVVLKNVAIDTIIVRRSPHHSHGVTGWVASAFCRVFPYQETLTVVVEGSSLIKKITFESQDGRVIVKGNHATVGDITGGTIYREQ